MPREKAFVLDVDAEHFGFDDIALLKELGRMFDLLGPVQIGDMHQSVDAFFDADKNAEVGDVAHRAFDHGADRVFIL